MCIRDRDEDEAQAFAVALTDVRLVVGERLALRTDEDADRLERALARDELDEQTGWLVAVYDFLTWLQETLTPVSYTHLDVYKRQSVASSTTRRSARKVSSSSVKRKSASASSARPTPATTPYRRPSGNRRPNSSKTVSYTHLDVYKRQPR